MKIIIPSEDDFPVLAGIWERAVRATHHFLVEDDILYYRSRLTGTYFPAVKLFAALDRQGEITGFMGMVGNRVEMLFVDPPFHGRGVGRGLMAHAASLYPVIELDVNEQNPGAVAFYEKCGFSVMGRSETDSEGRPFPLLHMRNAK